MKKKLKNKHLTHETRTRVREVHFYRVFPFSSIVKSSDLITLRVCSDVATNQTPPYEFQRTKTPIRRSNDRNVYGQKQKQKNRKQNFGRNVSIENTADAVPRTRDRAERTYDTRGQDVIV